MFCPFHSNTNSPAAKLYGNSMKCFSYARWYNVSDLLKTFNLEKYESIKTSKLITRNRVDCNKPLAFIPRAQLDISLPISEIINLIVR